MSRAAQLLLILLLTGFAFGDGLKAGIAAWRLFRERKRSRQFKYLSVLFAALALYIPAVVLTASLIPKPSPLNYRIALLVSLCILAAGIWPAALVMVFPEDSDPPVTQSGPVYQRSVRISIGTMGATVALIAVGGMVGHLTGQPLFAAWIPGTVMMALSTATGLLLSGAALLTIALASESARRATKPPKVKRCP